MHISEGILSTPVLLTGWAIAAAGVGVGIKKMKYEKIPEVAVLTSGFFIASLIHVPVGPSSIHLVLNGLLGILLGLSSFPAIFVGLLLQALLFQYGGITVLGVNTLNIALPALICAMFFKLIVRRKNKTLIIISGFLCGVFSVLCSSLLVAFSLVSSGEVFLNAAKLLVVSHIPVMILEGIITVVVLKFLLKVKPEMIFTEQCVKGGL